MATAKITLIGMYNVRPDIFDDLTFPAGIDKDEARDSILLRSGEFEILYPDPDFLKAAIGVWSKKWRWTFEKWYKATQASYDPISNYDRNEEWTDDNTGKSTVNGTTTDSASAGVENKISAYNAGTYQNDNKSDTSSSSSSTLKNTNTSSNLNKRKGRAWGNIGVTTSQQMLEAEFNVAKWNLYDHISDIFCSEFVIPVY